MSTYLCSCQSTALRQSGQSVPLAAALEGKKFIFIYFSAHWCPPCRAFTPQLKNFYDAHHNSKEFEIIFSSLDHSEGDMRHYFRSAHGDWLCVPYAEGKQLSDTLMKAYGQFSIPSLVLLENTPELGLVTRNGRSMVVQDPSAASFPWRNADELIAQQRKTTIRNVLACLAVCGVLWVVFLS